MPANPIVVSYCSTFLEPEERHLYRHVTGLRTFDAVVVCRNRVNEEQFPFDKVRIYRPVPFNAIRRSWLKFVRRAPPVVYRGEFRVFTGIVEQGHFDLLHFDSGHSGVDFLPILQRWPKPVLLSIRSGDIRVGDDAPDFQERLKTLLRIVRLVVVPSENLKERLIRIGCPETKIRLNPVSIPTDEFPFRERCEPEHGAWHLVQAGPLVGRRGVDMTLRVFARLLKDCPEASLTIAGRGPQEASLREYARELGIEEKVRFAGVLDGPETCDLFHRSHIFIQPSRTTTDGEQEAVSSSILEAMSTGLPVLATRHGGIPEAVEHGETGLLSAEIEEDALHANLLRIINRIEERRAMEMAAASRVRERFDQNQWIDTLEAIYRETMG